MNNEQLKAYDAAAATLEDSLRVAYPDCKWHVPTSWAALFSEEVKMRVMDGWLVAYVQRDGYGAYITVTVGLEQDPDVVRIVGQQVIDTMEKARHEAT